MDGGGVRVAGREHQVVGGTPEGGGHGKTGELVTGGGHSGGLGLCRVGGILEVHALETMSQCCHIGSRMASLRTVGTVEVVVAGQRLTVCRTTLVTAVVVVATLTLSVGHA